MRIVRARPQALPAINALIARSKAHWDWPEAYLDQALPFHRLTAAYLGGNACFEVVEDGRTIAFVSLSRDDRGVVLDNLWVEPARIGQGVGRRAWRHVVRLARRQGWREILVLPDPPAEGFYLAMGFVDTGERVASRVPGGPVFPVLRARIAAGETGLRAGASHGVRGSAQGDQDRDGEDG